MVVLLLMVILFLTWFETLQLEGLITVQSLKD